MNKVHNLLCYWIWDKKKDRSIPGWYLEKSVLYDCYHKPVGEEKALAWNWINTPGRAITIWSSLHGVTLHDLNPPGDYPKWLSGGALEQLKLLPNWALFLECGHTLLFETQEVAERYIADPSQPLLKKRMKEERE